MEDHTAPRDRADAAIRTLKPGTWEGVESLALLAIEFRGTPRASELLDLARAGAARLRPGNWDSVRALAWLSRAERELA